MSASSSTGINPVISRCVVEMKDAKSDSEVFAALLIASKILKTEGNNKEGLDLLKNAISFDFLKRMIRSSTSCNDTESPNFMYKSVAYSILSSLCTDENFATSAKMFSLISYFLQTIEQNPTDADDQFMVSDVMHCFLGMSQYEESRKKLIEQGVIQIFLKMIDVQHLYQEEALSCLTTLLKLNSIEIFAYDNSAILAILPKVVWEFTEDQDERKFELCKLLAHVIGRFSCFKIEESMLKSSEWLPWLHKGLKDILMSKISKDQRIPALQLLSSIVNVLPVSWLILDGDEENRKFFLGVLNLTCIEIRMDLECSSVVEFLLLEDHATLAICYNILEKMIIAVAENIEPVVFNFRQTLQLHSAISGAMKAVFSFLTEVHKVYLENVDFSITFINASNIIGASVRIICAWLCEETLETRQEMLKVLPFLLEIANENLNKRNENSETVDLLPFFIRALSHSVDAESIDVIVQTKFHLTLINYLFDVWKICLKTKPRTFDPVLENNCNLLVNIICDRKQILCDQIFQKVLNFVVDGISLLAKEHLGLRANMALLGLQIMEANCLKVYTKESTYLKFISITVAFLWDAIGTEVVNDATKLSVSLEYHKLWESIKELWSLGLHLLTQILSKVPWVCDFIMESGWIPSLIRDFGAVKDVDSLDEFIKRPLEEFFVSILRSDNHGKQFQNLLKESGRSGKVFLNHFECLWDFMDSF